MRLALSDVGVVSGRQGHLPFGEDFGESGTQEKHHFTSYERDSEVSSDHAGNREYSQGVGRFMRVDPYEQAVGNPQSHNRYAYVENDPANYVDPIGLRKVFAIHFLEPNLWFVFMGPPDPEESSDGGTGSGILYDVESAVKNLGPGCKKFFGEEFLSNAASFARGITVVDRESPDANRRIPGSDRTFAQFYDGLPADVIGAVVTGGPTNQMLSYIVVGANFAVPGQRAEVRDAFYAYYLRNGGTAAWQRDTLFHEFMHILTRQDDIAMAADWKDKGADLGDISTDRKASQQMSLFAARDCPKKKQ